MSILLLANRKKKKLYPRDVNGCVLSLIAKQANAGQVPLSSTAVWSDRSKARTSYSYSNMLGNQNTDNEMLNITLAQSFGINTNGGIGSTASLNKINIISGRKYFIITKWRTGTTPSNINLLRYYGGAVIADSTSVGTITHTTDKSYCVFTAPSTDLVGFIWRNNIEGSNYYHDWSMVIDLTALGLDTLSVAQCDALFPFTSTTGVVNRANDCLMVNQAGSAASGFNNTTNIFDGAVEQGTYNIGNGGKGVFNTYTRSVNYTGVLPNTAYSATNISGLTNVYAFYYDTNKTYISYLSLASTSFTTPNNCYYVTFTWTSSYTPSALVQVAIGSTETGYVPPFKTVYFNKLDGSDDYGAMANTPSLDITTQEIALACTFRVATSGNGWLICKNENGSDAQYGLYYYNVGKRVFMSLNGSLSFGTPINSILENTWYSVIFIRQNGVITPYINKVSQPTFNYANALISKPFMRLGAYSNSVAGTSNTLFIKGDIATQSIYTTPTLNIQDIIRKETYISKDYTGVN